MEKYLNVLKTLLTCRLTLTFDKIEFTYNKLSRKRLLNWFLAEFSYVLKSKYVWAYPTHLQIEPVSGCNLACPLCYITTQKLPKGFLPLERFQRIIDEVGEYIFFLHFWGWGEPFLNKDIFAMIAYAKQHGLKIITSTNGHFFEHLEDIDRLLDSGLDVLIFALDGVNQETYEHYRKQGDFERALEGLKLLLSRRKARGLSHPLLNLRMVISRENEAQIPKMKQLARSLGVDVLTLKTLYSHGNNMLWEQSLPQNPEYLRYDYDARGQAIRKPNSCKKMWNHCTIFHDGVVVPCDYFLREEFSLGNIFSKETNSFRDIWFGEKFQTLRARFLQGEYDGLHCKDCPLNFTTVDHYVSHIFSFKNKAPSH